MNEKSHLEGKLKMLEATEPVLEMDFDLDEITEKQDWQKPWDVWAHERMYTQLRKNEDGTLG